MQRCCGTAAPALSNGVTMIRSTTRLLHLVVAALLPLALIGGSGPALAQSDALPEELPYVEQAELAAVIKSRNVDQILETLNKVKGMRYQGLILPYVLDLWNLRQDKYPDLPWDVLSFDIVRLDIGNVLAQASRNGRIEVDSDAIHDFAYPLVSQRRR